MIPRTLTPGPGDHFDFVCITADSNRDANTLLTTDFEEEPTSLEFGTFGTALIIAGLFLFFGLFIDAIPTIIILGTVLMPAAAAADIHPLVFAIIGIVSLAFGLVTPPYGLCLLISAAIGGMNVMKVIPDVIIILLPMLLILLLIILFPEIALFLPETLMPDSFG